MEHLPALIYDLALILIVAGATTLIFKMLKQPLVLGYIVAGFLAGPHFHLFFTISDKENLHTWSEIGIIFLLFALGLEFSIKKIKSVGHTAVITAITEVSAMLVIGYICGQFMGWNTMDSIFLGGMLSMSSTTIIIKAFEDLNLKGKRFTELVFGSLIIEDIAGIIMMVMLATIAVSNEVSGFALVQSILQLSFFLILWFILGIFIVPAFFRRTHKSLNDETLLIVALGMCLGMVVIANEVGLSSALGAFITGSILAETRQAHRIEHLLVPVRDLFGAIFFVSVGMMVNPSQLVEYSFPILIVVIATIVGKLIFSTLGLLLSGETLKTSMQGGFSLAQIGEFAFIVAGLGQSLGITSDFLYPIVVTVSVITTFTTPFFVSLALPAHAKLEKILPQSIKDFLDRYTSDSSENTKDRHWRQFLQDYFPSLIIQSVLLGAIVFLSFEYSYIISDNIPGIFGAILETVIPLVIMSPFLRALLLHKTSRPELVSTLWFKTKRNRLPLLVLLALRIILANIFIFIVLFKFLPLHPIFILILALIIARFIYSSDWLLGQYLRIEASFLINLNEKQLSEKRELAKERGEKREMNWIDQELQVACLTLVEKHEYVKKELKTLAFREKFGINLLQIIRTNGKVINMPGGNIMLRESDTLVALGTQAQLDLFCYAAIQDHMTIHDTKPEYETLREFVIEQKRSKDKSTLLVYAVIIKENSPLIGKSIKDSDIRDDWHCLVLGLERGVYSMLNPHISLTFQKDDILWIIGKEDMLGELARSDLL